jgi:hypothetical protein
MNTIANPDLKYFGLTNDLLFKIVFGSKGNEKLLALLRNKFEKWLHILKFGDYYRSKADLPRDLQEEKGISEVIQKMSIANTDEQMRHELLARDMFLSDLATDLDAAEKKGRQEGRQKGRQEGRQEGKVEAALSMLADGLPAVKVSKYTGLTIDEVNQLQKNNSSNKVSESATKYKAKRKPTKPRKK